MPRPVYASPAPPPSTTTPDLFFSYYPYPVTARTKTHDSILRPISAVVRDRRLSDAREAAETAALPPGAGVNGSAAHGAKRQRTKPRHEGYTRLQQAMALDAAEKRAIRGIRPAGVDLAKDADELSEEERIMDDERDNLNLFGHRFLLPFGRRQTQAETEALPQSPTPSQDQDDRRQEDQINNLGSSPPLMNGGMDGMGMGPGTGIDEDEEPERDLDASVEDMDADVEDLDASVEDLDAGYLEED